MDIRSRSRRVHSTHSTASQKMKSPFRTLRPESHSLSEAPIDFVKESFGARTGRLRLHLAPPRKGLGASWRTRRLDYWPCVPSCQRIGLTSRSAESP